jgi:hypothetical protein
LDRNGALPGRDRKSLKQLFWTLETREIEMKILLLFSGEKIVTQGLYDTLSLVPASLPA